jgi:hypothetical protein
MLQEKINLARTWNESFLPRETLKRKNVKKKTF